MPDTTVSIRQPLRLHIKPSRCLLVLLLLIHAGAALCVISTPLPGWLSLGCGMLIRRNFYHTVSTQLRWRRRAIPRELVMQQHQFYLDDERLAEITYSYVRHFWVLTYLRLPDGRRENLLICADSLPPDAFRRLRVRLKYPQQRNL